MVSLNNIPTYLKAKSPQGLRRLMLSNNVKHGGIFEYQIMFVGEYWYAWYRADAKTFLGNIIEENGDEK